MTATDTLRTEVHWETSQLEAENRKLRSENEAASKLVDLESELE
jgi:hypothetical protein